MKTTETMIQELATATGYTVTEINGQWLLIDLAVRPAAVTVHASLDEVHDALREQA